MSQLAFHNTNQESGATLQASQEQARAQEAVILRVFESWPVSFYAPIGFTPSQVSYCLGIVERNWPITSVRRAITMLTKQGKLEKTSLLRMGPQGKREHVWRLAQ